MSNDFIELTANGRNVYINIDHVVMVQDHCGGAKITFASGKEVCVDDPPSAFLTDDCVEEGEEWKR